MKIIIIGASGGTGRELTKQALARGYDVIAVVRNLSSMKDMKSNHLTVREGDVYRKGSIASIVSAHPDAVLVSGLGVSGKDKKNRTDVLATGASEVIAAHPMRIVWLGAFGSGASAQAAGWLTRKILSLMGDRLKDKVSADTQILNAGGSVFHAGILTDGPLSSGICAVELQHAPRSFLPRSISRANVASLMLDEASSPRFTGSVGLVMET